MSAVQYGDPDDVLVTECENCPWSANDGWYIWCPTCGSTEVRYL
jgi:Zn finger protein HypA/HybF involved in hydrogenase expression